jgi:hypothetical protein
MPLELEGTYPLRGGVDETLLGAPARLHDTFAAFSHWVYRKTQGQEVHCGFECKDKSLTAFALSNVNWQMRITLTTTLSLCLTRSLTPCTSMLS